jgi:hypothetical protein
MIIPRECRMRRYAAPKVGVVTLLITGFAWLTSLSVIALVPIDVYTTLAHWDVPALKPLWKTSFW